MSQLKDSGASDTAPADVETMKTLHLWEHCRQRCPSGVAYGRVIADINGANGRTVTDLTTKHGIHAASEVILTGGSAGGMSVFLHADFIRAGLGLRSSAAFGAVPLSGFFLDRVNVYGEPVFQMQARGMYQLANPSAGLPRNCVSERPLDVASCIFPEHAYNSIDSPIFVVDSTLDAYQIPCILGRNGTAQTWANSTCGSAADYQNCTKIWGDRPLNAHCSRDQMYTLIEYQGSFMRKISTKRTFGKLNTGAFLYQCFTHVAANYPSWNQFILEGVSMQQAVTKWWNGVRDGGNHEALVYTDRIWGLDGVATNPTCTCTLASAGRKVGWSRCWLRSGLRYWSQ